MIYGKITKQSKYLMTPVVFATALNVYAQDQSELPDFTEEDIFIDIPQVISATHLSQKLTEAPAAITIIDQDMIEASGAINIPDLFRLVPGMQVYHISTNKMGVTYHGMSDDFPSRMEVMINGRSIYIPLLSTVVWETVGITLDDIDHIEVVRGSNVPTHGSNAFLGAINIITKSPVAESGTAVRTTTGALGTQNITARHSNTLSNISYTLSAGREENDGSDYYKDGARNTFITLSGSITPNLSDTIHFDIGATKGYAYRGDSDKTDLIDANFSPRDHESNFQDFRWSRVLDNQSELQLRYTHNYLNLDTENYNSAEQLALYEGIPSIGPFTSVEIASVLLEHNNGIAPRDTERGTIQTHEVGLLYTSNPTNNINLALGSEFKYERAKSDILLQYPDKEWIDESSWQLFGNIQYQATEKITLNAGSMLEKSSIAGSAISYRTALNYALSDTSSVRTAHSQAHRMPSLLEANRRYIVDISAIALAPAGTLFDNNVLPNRDLEPEQINSFEIGFLKLWPEYHSHFDLRVFYEDINDAVVRSKRIDTDVNIDEPFNDHHDISANNGEWTNQGAELQFKYTVPGPHKNTILFNYSYNQTRGIWNRGAYKPPEGDPRIVPLNPVSPLHTASLVLSAKPTNNSLLSLSQYYMDHAEWLEGFSDKNSGRTNYTRTDMKVSNTFQLDMNTELEVSLIVQNLFDKEYAEFYSNNIFERRTYLQMGLTF
ncbi:TonB-dependent receptor plug domain-containing protein [Neptuniibacter sp. QD34_54]|uniref:TonB-dependent receptor plug domain-containing protein n=1 Tax=Neptuniibacter sp. QD34_54 TaxID=3398208 RepID=UPI0039F477D0